MDDQILTGRYRIECNECGFKGVEEIQTDTYRTDVVIWQCPDCDGFSSIWDGSCYPVGTFIVHKESRVYNEEKDKT